MGKYGIKKCRKNIVWYGNYVFDIGRKLYMGTAIIPLILEEKQGQVWP